MKNMRIKLFGMKASDNFQVSMIMRTKMILLGKYERSILFEIIL
jgi:hypothetical protein